MKKIKGIRHEKEFDTVTLVTDISEEAGGKELVDRSTKETVDRKTLSDTHLDLIEGQPTQVYEPRPLTPDDDIYEEIIEQFATAPTKPKYWFEEFGDYWSCSCGHINRGDNCKSCGLERELLRSLFILHKPVGEVGNLDKNLKKSKDQADKEAAEYADKKIKRKEREASGEDLTKVVPIETTSENSIIPVKPEKSSKKKKIIIAIAVCLILVGACGFAIYKHMAAPAMLYEEAQQLMDDGKYEQAIEKYESLGDYKDSQQMIWQCWILLGDKYMDAQEYEKAIGAYSVAAEIAPGDDVMEKINAAKLAYVKAYQSDRTEQVESYLDELMEVEYPGAKEIYDAYYAWNASLVANTSDSDYSTDVTTVSRKDTVYFHAILNGGEPDETIQLYYEVTWPDGRSEIYNLDSYWRAGDKISARFQYAIPLFGKEGKLTFTLYDKQTKEALGSDSITFKN